MVKKLVFILAICLSYSLFFPTSVKAKDENSLLTSTLNLQNSLEVLSQAQGIEGAYLGFAAVPNPAYQPLNRAFKQAVARGNAVNLSQIEELMKQASPAGRLYLAALLQRLNKKEGDRVLNTLISDTSTVTERSGCTIDSRKVGDVAQELLKNGSIAIAIPLN
jgi:hypothetical protein